MENNYFYCERNNLEFLSEPLNFFTNFSFLLISIILYYDKRVTDKNYSYIIFLIGISSSLFHSIQNHITALLDVSFIAVFIIYYLNNLYKSFNINAYISFILSILFILFCSFFGYLFNTSILSSSAYYFPILLHLYFLSLFFYIKKKIYIQYKMFIGISILFTLSLFLRTIDLRICSYSIIGTHYLWHILNSIILYLLIKYIHLIINRPSPKKPT